MSDHAIEGPRHEPAGNRRNLRAALALPNWLFDMDGVVVDSSAVHAQAFRDAFEEVGLPFEDYARYAGMTTVDVVRTCLVESRSDPSPDLVRALAARKQSRTLELLGRDDALVMQAGMKDVLECAGRAGKRLALVSSASGARVRATLDSLGLSAAFEYVVTAEDVSRGKPSPDPYLEALARLGDGEVASNCVVFEDSRAGVLSAANAGMRVIHFQGHGLPDPACDATIASFSEIAALMEMA